MLSLIFRNKQILTLALFFVFLVTLIFAPNDANSKAIAVLVLFSFCFFNLNELRNFTQRHYPLLILFLLICLSLVYTDNLTIGLKKIQRVFIVPMLLLVFSFLRLSKSSTWIILRIFVVLVLLAALFSHIVIITQFLDNEESSYRSLFNLNYSYFSLGKPLGLHPTYFSYFVLAALVILLQFLRQGITVGQKILLLSIIAYLSFFVIHLSSRTSIVILYLIIIYNILDYSFKSKELLKGVLFLLLFHSFLAYVVLNVGVTKYRFQHIFGFTYYTGYTVNDGNHKLNLWSAALKANNNILIGNGMGDIQSSLQIEYAKAGLIKPLRENYNSHNQYIEYYVGLGFLGFLTLCYLLLYYALVFLRENNQIGFQFIAITGIICLTECVFSRHHGIVFFCFMLFLLLGFSPEKVRFNSK